jgi:hypothetical protein
MERFLQYLDDIDDIFGMAGLVVERLRRFTLTLFSWLLILGGAVAGAWLAQVHPPIALATLILLFVTLLYRSVTQPAVKWTEVAG